MRDPSALFSCSAGRLLSIFLLALLLSSVQACNLPTPTPIDSSPIDSLEIEQQRFATAVQKTQLAAEERFSPQPPAGTRSLTLWPTVTASPQTPTPDHHKVTYQEAFGIDYRSPERYLVQGEQSRISDTTALDGLRDQPHGMAQLASIWRWLIDDFASYSAGGKTIGVVTVDQLLEERRLGGCHDYALLYAAIARELGYPAVMNRTNSLAWVERFKAGKEGPYCGHVFVEVYFNARWVLIDSTGGWYVGESYDPANPVIPLRRGDEAPDDEMYGYYVERKGIDVWDFGIHSQEESTQAMDEFARQLDLSTITYPDYDFQRFTD